MMMSPFPSLGAMLPSAWNTGTSIAGTSGNRTATAQNALPQNQPSQALSLESPSSFTPGSLSAMGANWFAPVTGWFNQAGQAVSNLSQSVGQAASAFSNALPNLGMTFGTITSPGSVVNRQSINTPVSSSPALFPASPTNQTPAMSPLNAMGTGARQAFSDLGTLAKNHAPALLTFGGMMMCSTAVCSFMGGTLAATGAVMMGQNMLANHMANK